MTINKRGIHPAVVSVKPECLVIGVGGVGPYAIPQVVIARTPAWSVGHHHEFGRLFDVAEFHPQKLPVCRRCRVHSVNVVVA